MYQCSTIQTIDAECWIQATAYFCIFGNENTKLLPKPLVAFTPLDSSKFFRAEMGTLNLWIFSSLSDLAKIAERTRTPPIWTYVSSESFLCNGLKSVQALFKRGTFGSLHRASVLRISIQTLYPHIRFAVWKSGRLLAIGRIGVPQFSRQQLACQLVGRSCSYFHHRHN